MSEAELHSLRLRLDAGRLSKARRGALIQPLPTGLLRTADGQVVIDPDKSIAGARIRLVFTKFQELGSGSKVLTLGFLVEPERLDTSFCIDFKRRKEEPLTGE